MTSGQSLRLMAALALILTTAIPLLGCGLLPTGSEPAREVQLTILHTNDVNGYVEPCG